MRHWIKRIPVIAPAQRWLVDRALSGAPFVHTISTGPAAGLRFEIMLPDDKAIWTGMFETEFSTALRNGTRPGDICYDIGSYRGYMSGVMALAGARQVVAFEPLPGNIAALHKFVSLNATLPIQVQEIAVGNSDGEVQFSVMADPSMGKLATSTFQSEAEFEQSLTVQMQRLDTLVFEQGLPLPDVIKIDVEGAEADVLKGAARTLAQRRARIFLEAHSPALARECSDLLSHLGFSVRQLEPESQGSEQTCHLLAEPA